MYRDKMKVLLVLYCGYIFMFLYCASASEQTNHTLMRLNEQKTNHKHQNSFFDQMYKSYNEIHERPFRHYIRGDVVSKMIQRNPQLNQIGVKQRRNNSIFLNSSSDISEKAKVSLLQLFDRRLVKRNINDRMIDVSSRRGIPKGKQKKAKALGRLLMNNVSNKNDDDIQDDYVEDEDDDYSKGLSNKKMNWEDFQNEDGASVMELIALNTRHKTNLHRAYGNE